MLWYFVAGFGVLFVAFIGWRYTSVARGARQRDERILRMLDPITEKLMAGGLVTTGEIESLAKRPAARPFLYDMLKHFEQLDLFPEQYKSESAQAEARLAYWMMHPNELQDAPEQIELVETVTRAIDDRPGRFYVFRYLMPNGHWAGQEWLLGLAGPYFDNLPPYAGPAGAFSRCGDQHGKVQPNELVDWYIGLFSQKRSA